MNRAGILLLTIAFAAAGCASRTSAAISALAGTGLVIGGGVAISNAHDHPTVGPGPKGGGALLITGGAVLLAAAAIGMIEQASEESEPSRWSPEIERIRRMAAHLARRERCDRVRELDVQVSKRDTAFHAHVFVRDAAIAKCLAQ